MNQRVQAIVNWFTGIEPRVFITALIFAVVAGAAAFVFTFVRSDTVDLRSAVPSDALGVMRAKDIGAVATAIARSIGGDRKPRDFSFLNGVEAIVVVTGFEASEQEITDGASILNLKPQFAAVAETNGWSWQTNGMIDGPINDFIQSQYGKGTKRQIKDGKYAKWTIWTASDGRRAFAAVEGTRIYLGNDEKSVERCISATHSEIPGIKDEKEFVQFFEENKQADMIGYFPRRAVEGFADVAGVSAAVSGSEEENTRAFIARLVPQLFRNTVEGIYWTSSMHTDSFEDRIEIKTTKDVAAIFSETLKPGSSSFNRMLKYLPPNTSVLTRYSVLKPRLAYRSLLLVTAKSTDPVSGQLISGFSDSLLLPYGVANAEAFLDAAGTGFITAQNGDNSIAIVEIKDRAQLLQTLSDELSTNREPEQFEGAEFWSSDDGLFAAAIVSGILIIGDLEAVKSGLKLGGNDSGALTRHPFFGDVRSSKVTAVTLDVSEKDSPFLTETGFAGSTFIRKYKSKSGLAGSLIAGFGN